MCKYWLLRLAERNVYWRQRRRRWRWRWWCWCYLPVYLLLSELFNSKTKIIIQIFGIILHLNKFFSPLPYSKDVFRSLPCSETPSYTHQALHAHAARTYMNMNAPKTPPVNFDGLNLNFWVRRQRCEIEERRRKRTTRPNAHHLMMVIGLFGRCGCRDIIILYSRRCHRRLFAYRNILHIITRTKSVVLQVPDEIFRFNDFLLLRQKCETIQSPHTHTRTRKLPFAEYRMQTRGVRAARSLSLSFSRLQPQKLPEFAFIFFFFFIPAQNYRRKSRETERIGMVWKVLRVGTRSSEWAKQWNSSKFCPIFKSIVMCFVGYDGAYEWCIILTVYCVFNGVYVKVLIANSNAIDAAALSRERSHSHTSHRQSMHIIIIFTCEIKFYGLYFKRSRARVSFGFFYHFMRFRCARFHRCQERLVENTQIQFPRDGKVEDPLCSQYKNWTDE